MNETRELSDFYTDFLPIDLDFRGGYSRVWQVAQRESENKNCAIKVMRHDLLEVGQKIFKLFMQEARLLSEVDQTKIESQYMKELTPVPHIYDTGFIHKSFFNKESAGENTRLIRSAVSINSFAEDLNELWTTGEWLPYLAIELAAFDDNILRYINIKKAEQIQDVAGVSLLESVVLTIRLLDLMDWLHETKNLAYIDWKPEHIFWNSESWELKLIDWNVYLPLDEASNKNMTRADDVRLMTATVLYTFLTSVDLEGNIPITPAKHPQTRFISTISRRLLVDNPEDLFFYSRAKHLDKEIREIVSKAMTGRYFQKPSELKETLLNYLINAFQLSEDIVYASKTQLESIDNPYIQAIFQLQLAKQAFRQAHTYLLQATKASSNPEIKRLSEMVNLIRKEYPIP